MVGEDGCPFRFTMCSGTTRDARGDGPRRDVLCKTRVGLLQTDKAQEWDWKAHWRKLTQLDLQASICYAICDAVLYAVLCCAICCAMLCYAVLCYAML